MSTVLRHWSLRWLLASCFLKSLMLGKTISLILWVTQRNNYLKIVEVIKHNFSVNVHFVWQKHVCEMPLILEPCCQAETKNDHVRHLAHPILCSFETYNISKYICLTWNLVSEFMIQGVWTLSVVVFTVTIRPKRQLCTDNRKYS